MLVLALSLLSFKKSFYKVFGKENVGNKNRPEHQEENLKNKAEKQFDQD